MLQTIGQMPVSWLTFALLATAGFIAFYAGRTRAMQLELSAPGRLNSQPNYDGYFVAIRTVVPLLLVFGAYALFGEALLRSILRSELPDGFAVLGPQELRQYLDQIVDASRVISAPSGNIVFDAVQSRYIDLRGMARLAVLGVGSCIAMASYVLARRKLADEFRARTHVEGSMKIVLFLSAAIAIATTVGIVVSLVFESFRFFAQVPVTDFLFGTKWNAQTNAEFGALPLFFGTFAISFIAMIVAAPIGLMAAIYLSEYASPRVRGWVKPLLEILAGIPTVVYGFFALLAVAPAVRSGAQWLNNVLIGLPFIDGPVFAAQPTSALAAGLVMGVMIIPFVSSLSDDVINAVPQTLRDGAFAMGATRSETVRQVVMPAALPGVIAALLLAVSRAIGETMIVVMAAGQRAQITADPTSDITTITVQIVSLLTGDSEFDSPKTLSAFALGLVLFLVTLGFNLIALRVVQKYREKYD